MRSFFLWHQISDWDPFNLNATPKLHLLEIFRYMIAILSAESRPMAVVFQRYYYHIREKGYSTFETTSEKPHFSGCLSRTIQIGKIASVYL